MIFPKHYVKTIDQGEDLRLSVLDVPPLFPLRFVLLERDGGLGVEFEDGADYFEEGERLVEGARCLRLYVPRHYVLQVLLLDLVAVFSFLGLLRDFEGGLAVGLVVVGRRIEVVGKDEVLQFLKGALANQFVFFILFPL